MIKEYKVIEDYFLGKCLCIPEKEIEKLYEEYSKSEYALYLKNPFSSGTFRQYAALRHFCKDLLELTKNSEIKYPAHAFKVGDVIVSTHDQFIRYVIIGLEMNELGTLDYVVNCLFSPYMGKSRNMTASMVDEHFVLLEEK